MTLLVQVPGQMTLSVVVGVLRGLGRVRYRNGVLWIGRGVASSDGR
ncbi:hypothetical protein [Thiorhodococcus minor]|uniref:Uncharacterized protein n=1 Tax=Thiorhodococcus minor TaxID=57489 RepID=A0A6M0JZ18_9GAMM|nr:hypothetical protein [Thiorhodococcus minor]NEV62419.1 hypothetical protein [Thiorhodococcus minor]